MRLGAEGVENKGPNILNEHVSKRDVAELELNSRVRIGLRRFIAASRTPLLLESKWEHLNRRPSKERKNPDKQFWL